MEDVYFLFRNFFNNQLFVCVVWAPLYNQIPGSTLVSSKHVLLWTAGDHNNWSDTGIWCGPGDWNAADDGGMDGKGKEGVHGEVCLDHVWPKWHWRNKTNMTIILIIRIRILIIILVIVIIIIIINLILIQIPLSSQKSSWCGPLQRFVASSPRAMT